jgi:hypothetical protein
MRDDNEKGRVMNAGFVRDLDEATYHADRTSLSVSGAKTLMKSPALFRHQQDNPVQKDTFDYGSAAHALVLGAGMDSIYVTPVEEFRTNVAKAEKEEARRVGLSIVTPPEWEQISAMADALSSHTLAMRLLSEGEPEISAYALDEETGVMRRGRFDWLGTSVLTDYKTCASANPRDLAGRYGVVKKWGYDAQAAWYTDLARDLGHPAAAFAFIFQEKAAPYQVTVAYVDDADLWDARQHNRAALERFRDCTESGFWPAYLSTDTAARLSLTDQTYYEEVI